MKINTKYYRSINITKNLFSKFYKHTIFVIQGFQTYISYIYKELHMSFSEIKLINFNSIDQFYVMTFNINFVNCIFKERNIKGFSLSFCFKISVTVRQEENEKAILFCRNNVNTLSCFKNSVKKKAKNWRASLLCLQNDESRDSQYKRTGQISLQLPG